LALEQQLHNNALHLTAPLGAVAARLALGASCSPFGEHRRRRWTRCSADTCGNPGQACSVTWAR